jgi:hypothetical protein
MTTEEIKTKWQTVASYLEGDLHFTSCIKSNVNAEVISAQINYRYQNVPIKVHQAIYNYGKGSYQYTLIQFFIIMAIENYELRVWQLDFFDKILKRSRPKLGNQEFDKIYGIYTSNVQTTQKILNDKEIIKTILSDKSQIINAIIENENSVFYLKVLSSPDDESRIIKYAEFFNTLVNRFLMYNLVKILPVTNDIGHG